MERVLSVPFFSKFSCHRICEPRIKDGSVNVPLAARKQASPNRILENALAFKRKEKDGTYSSRNVEDVPDTTG